MAYVSKRVYGILMSKAKKDNKVKALLNMLKDMPQEEANIQVQAVMKSKSGVKPMTGDYEKAKREPRREDRTSLEANRMVDSGKSNNYDDAYDNLAKIKSQYGRSSILKQNNLPLEYATENILLEQLKSAGFEIKKIDGKDVIVIMEGEEYELPISREEEKIRFIK